MSKIEIHEDELEMVNNAAKAAELASEIFGAQSNTVAVFELVDYLAATDDEEQFIADLKRVVEHAKKVFKIDAPTPEQVFGLFGRIFADED